MSTERQKFKSAFIDLAKSKGYKIIKPSYSERKNNIDLKLEGQTKGKPTTVTVDIKKRTVKTQTLGFTLSMQIQKVEKAGFMEPHNSLFLKLEVVLFLFLEKIY